MEPCGKVRSINAENCAGLIGDGMEEAAGGEKPDSSNVIGVGRDLHMVAATHRVGRAKVEQGESSAPRRIRNSNGKRRARLSMNMRAFIRDGGEFVITVGQSSGIEVEGASNSRSASGNVEMISGLQIEEVLIKSIFFGWTFVDARRAGEQNFYCGTIEASGTSDEVEGGGLKGAGPEVLNGEAVG